uniref:Uncharacterized protein n=1 Tax=Glossina palpalis gambiensis TaxID=67801 RepID=A0A1B0B788_9MUSC
FLSGFILLWCILLLFFGISRDWKQPFRYTVSELTFKHVCSNPKVSCSAILNITRKSFAKDKYHTQITGFRKTFLKKENIVSSWSRVLNLEPWTMARKQMIINKSEHHSFLFSKMSETIKLRIFHLTYFCLQSVQLNCDSNAIKQTQIDKAEPIKSIPLQILIAKGFLDKISLVNMIS